MKFEAETKSRAAPSAYTHELHSLSLYTIFLPAFLIVERHLARCDSPAFVRSLVLHIVFLRVFKYITPSPRLNQEAAKKLESNEN